MIKVNTYLTYNSSKEYDINVPTCLKNLKRVVNNICKVIMSRKRDIDYNKARLQAIYISTHQALKKSTNNSQQTGKKFLDYLKKKLEKHETEIPNDLDIDPKDLFAKPEQSKATSRSKTEFTKNVTYALCSENLNSINAYSELI